jgi:ubiquinone/menaquinone biosynthesis C-methylase UbiE
MTTDPVAAAKFTFDLAAGGYDAPELEFFRTISNAIVDRMNLDPSAHVLDVPCGTGHATKRVLDTLGPNGRVHAIDLSPNMLALASNKVGNDSRVSFEQGDMRALHFADGTFAEVVCIFGIFFLPHMPAGMRELWRLVAPGGRLTVATWKPNFFGTVNQVFLGRIHKLRPDLVAVDPSTRKPTTGTIETMQTLIDAANIQGTVEHAEFDHAQTLTSSASWWTLELGAGRRGHIEALTKEERTDVQGTTERHIAAHNVNSLPCDSLITAIRKPIESLLQ